MLKVEFAPSFLYVGANGKMQFNVGIKWLLDHLNQDRKAGSSQVNVVWGRGPSRGNGRLGLIILPAIGCHCLAHKVEENLNICGIELQTINRLSYTITKKAFSWLKAPTSAFTFKTLLNEKEK